jgi:hypothetical protein
MDIADAVRARWNAFMQAIKVPFKEYDTSGSKSAASSLPASGKYFHGEKMLVGVDFSGLPHTQYFSRNSTTGRFEYRYPVAAVGSMDAMMTASMFMSASGTALQPEHCGQSWSPYASDGVTAYLCTQGASAHGTIKSTSVEFAVAADGSVGAVTLIAAGGAGVKNVITDCYVSYGAGAIVASERPVICNLALSDGIGFVGTGAPLMGPQKQTTANTLIALSAAAGRCSPTAGGARGTITTRYWAGA